MSEIAIVVIAILVIGAVVFLKKKPSDSGSDPTAAPAEEVKRDKDNLEQVEK